MSYGTSANTPPKQWVPRVLRMTQDLGNIQVTPGTTGCQDGGSVVPVWMSIIQDFLDSFQAWAVKREDIQALALVGSHARGTHRPDSDVDLVVLTTNPGTYLRDVEWASRFGTVDKCQIEPYGDLTSIHAWYLDGREVEYGFTRPEWARSTGGRAVLAAGVRVLFDNVGTGLGEFWSRRPDLNR